jgi:hypothetical protein
VTSSQPEEKNMPNVVHGTHSPPNKSTSHTGDLELLGIRTFGGKQIYHCRTCDEYASEATVVIDQDCGLCGEEIDFGSTSDPGGEFTGKDGGAVIAHAQCGLDHGLTPA